MDDVKADSLWATHKYAAFISYSRADLAAGDKFQRGIERYRIPKPLVARGTLNGPVPKRLVPIFRDITDMVAAGDLGAQIEKTLEESAFLILICSPHSAKSMWVNTEVETFKRKGAKSRIIPVLLDGEPVEYHPEHAPNGAFPPALLRVMGPDGQLTDEREPMPIAPDLRPTAEGYDYAVLKTVATMIGLAPDILSQRQSEMERRERRLARMVAGVVTVLAVAATGAAIAAWQQMVTARENQSRAFAGLAWNKIEEGNYDFGARLGLQGLPAGTGNLVKASSTDAEDAMQAALWNNRVTARFLPRASIDTDPLIHMELSHDGSTAAAVSTVGSIRVIDVASGQLKMSVPYQGRVAESDYESMYSAALSPDGSRLITFALFSDEPSEELKACGLDLDPEQYDGPWYSAAGAIWDTSTGCPVAPLQARTAEDGEDGWISVGGFEWSPDGSQVLVTSWARTSTRVVDLESGAVRFIIRADSEGSDMRFGPMPVYTSDSNRLLAKTGRYDVAILDAATGKSIRTLTVPESLNEWGDPNWITDLSLSRDEKRVRIGMSDGGGYLLDLATGQPLESADDVVVRESWGEDDQFMPVHKLSIFSPANPWDPIWTADYDEHVLMPEDGVMVGFKGAQGEVRDLLTGRLQIRLTGHMTPVSAVMGVAGGGVVLTGDDTGELRRWSIVPRAPLGTVADVRSAARGIDGQLYALSADGSQLSTLSPAFEAAPAAVFSQPMNSIQVLADRVVATGEGGFVESVPRSGTGEVLRLENVKQVGQLPAKASGAQIAYLDAERALVLAGAGLGEVRLPENDHYGWAGAAFAEAQDLVIGMDRTKLVAFHRASQEVAWTFEGFPEDLAKREEALDNPAIWYRQLETKSVLLSPDGSRLLLAFDNSPRAEYNADHAVLLDTMTGAIVMRLPFGAYEDMAAAGFVGDGEILITNSRADTGSTPDFRIWRASDGAFLSGFNVPHDPEDRYGSFVQRFSVSPSGKRIAAQQANKIFVFGASTGRLIADITADLSEAVEPQNFMLGEDHAVILNKSGELLKVASPDEADGPVLAARACEALAASGADVFAPEELAQVSIPEDRRQPCARGGLLSWRFYENLISN